MNERLSVPPELEHLIEKREAEERRLAEQRAKQERREVDLGPLGSIESAAELDQIALEERRKLAEQREAERRQDARREDDDPPAADRGN